MTAAGSKPMCILAVFGITNLADVLASLLLACKGTDTALWGDWETVIFEVPHVYAVLP